MISRYSVWLNDVSLSEVDPEIYVSDIGYNAVSRQFNTSRLAARDGLFSGDDYFGENKTTVTFLIRKYNTQERQSVLQNILVWAANGGWLKTSDRPFQRIYVKCTRLPSINSVMRWTDNLTLEFTAYDFPYWQDEEPMTISLDSGENETVYIPSAFNVYVEAKITAAASLTQFSISVGDTTLSFANLSVSSGDIITVAYSDEHHILDVSVGTLSILDKRTANSSDDLIAKTGNNIVSFSTSGGSAECELYFRGVYL